MNGNKRKKSAKKNYSFFCRMEVVSLKVKKGDSIRFPNKDYPNGVTFECEIDMDDPPNCHTF
jgi:hypothetical protein